MFYTEFPDDTMRITTSHDVLLALHDEIDALQRALVQWSHTAVEGCADWEIIKAARAAIQ
jgi:hypothetical protein